jgi:hypothetical protein
MTETKHALEVTLDGDRPQIDSLGNWRLLALDLNPELLPTLTLIAGAPVGATMRATITPRLGEGTVRNLGAIEMEVR